MNTALKIFFKFISLILHPLLLPTYGTLLYLWANPSMETSGLWPRAIASIFFNSFVMPAVAIAMMKALGFIKTFEMHDKQERIIPFIATMIFYIWTFMAVKVHLGLPYVMTVFILGTLVSVMLSFFINLFFKLSIHMVGMGGLLTATMLMMMTSERPLFLVLLGIVVLNGLVATARLYLKAHTPKELYVGFMIGILGQMAGLFIYTKFLT